MSPAPPASIPSTLRLPALFLLVLTLACAAHAEDRPTRASLQKVLDRYQRSVVDVRGPRHRGPGIIVGAGGQVLTAVSHVGLRQAEVRVDGAPQAATVRLANAALRFAMVDLAAGDYAATPVHPRGEAPVGQWVIGVVKGKKGRMIPTAARARASRAPFIEVALALPPGSPLFDREGRLVAVAVERMPRGRCRALPLNEVKLQLAASDGP